MLSNDMEAQTLMHEQMCGLRFPLARYSLAHSRRSFGMVFYLNTLNGTSDTSYMLLTLVVALNVKA
jgi:hypothetical protein